MIQKIWLSEWCPYDCEFCYNGRKSFKDLPIPEIQSNSVQILDPAFLTKKNIIDVINELGNKRVNNKVVYYELVQGINYKDLTQDIANTLKLNRFINIRFAWDRKYNKFYMFKAYDCKQMLIKAGYNPKTIMCFIIVNWLVPYKECVKKLNLLNRWGLKVGNCCYDGGYPKSEIDYNTNKRFNNKRFWKYLDIKTFGRTKSGMCRKHNQIIIFGIDPELK